MKNKINNKNKFLLSIFIAVLIFASLGSVLAKDIAYIAKDTTHLDSSIVSLLNQGEYTYDIIYQTALSSTNFSNYSIILVGEGIFNDYTQIPVNIKNSVILNTYYIDEWHWSGSGVSTKSSNFPSEVVVFDGTSSITDGISEYFTPYSTTNDVIVSYDLKYISKLSDAPGLKTIVADGMYFLHIIGINVPSNGAVVAVMNNGSVLKNGEISKARGVFLGFPQTQLWTEQTKRIFYNSLNWAIAGEDKDGDGFFTDMDCNDEDASVNPNGTEIAYDGIDQNCDGTDWNDLDEDGFIGAEAGGDDCNDNDSSYNINSSDLTKNCLNDAPIIENILRMQVHETEIVNLYVNASDPEEDTMTFSINDSRFVQDENDDRHFTWQTTYEDAGDYNFFIRVDDGDLYSEKKFSVKVWNKNKAPDLLMDIPPQEWDEDGNHTLNLSEYFSDADGNTLIYFVYDTSDDLNIHVIKIENGIVYFNSNKNWNGEDWIIFAATDGDGTINATQTNNITLRVLPVNDAPVLIKEIGTINASEDIVYNLNLNQYFYDVDSTLEYTFENTSHTALTLNGNILSITPEENWYGEEDSQIKASDGEFELVQDFIINVASVNDPPVLSPIGDKYVLAGGKVSFDVSATDIEGDTFNFSMDDLRFVKEGENSFSWQTGERDFGVYSFWVSAYDGMNYGNEKVKINVLQKIFINEFVWGNEGWIELYNPENTNLSLSNCLITNGDEDLILYGNLGNRGYSVFGWNALKNNGAIELSCNGVLIDSVEYEEFNLLNSLGRKTDGFNNGSGESFVLFDYPTRGVSNSADVTKPEVTLEYPEDNTLFTETRDVTFNFTGIDNMAETLSCKLVANLKTLETGEFENNTHGSFFIDYLPDGIYTWNVECSDGTNKNTAQNSRIINISAPDAPTLNYIGNKVVSENTELRFYVYSTDQDNDPIKLYTSEIPDGASFTDNKNGNGVYLWKPNYNQSGSYTIKFTAEDDTGLKDSETITILVGNAKEPPKFSDADVCKVKNTSMEISIKDPSKGDDFEIGDTINGTIKIKNNFDDSRDFEVHVYLYDLNDEQTLEEYDDNIKVKEGKSGDLDFSIKIPGDIENKDFAIYAYAEGDDETECNSNYVEISINRKKHDVVISDITTDMESLSPGEQLTVNVKAENLGKNDEDTSILLEIPSIGISQRSNKFTIEKYGDKDSKTETFYVTIPESAQIGNYEIKASVAFNGGENYNTKEFEVTKGIGETPGTVNQAINLNSIPLYNSKGTPLTLGNPSGNSGPGSPLVLGNPSTGYGSPLVIGNPSTSSSLRKPLFGRKTVNLGVNELNQKEYTPNVKVEFDGSSDRVNNSKWILLAAVLGLLVIIIFILILILM